MPIPRRRLRALGLEGNVLRVTLRHNRRLRFDTHVARGIFPDALAAVVAKSMTYGWHARAHVPYHLRRPAPWRGRGYLASRACVTMRAATNWSRPPGLFSRP